MVSPAGEEKEIALRDEKSLHSYPVSYDSEGTWTLIAETTPGYFAMYTDKKGRKRHSLKPLSSFIENASEVESSMRSSQWTKAYVTCEKPSPDFPSRAGLPLEIVPLKNPQLLKEGDSLEVQVYNDGKPYLGNGAWDATYNGFSTEAEDMFIPRTEVKGGVFTIPVDHSGRWFVRFFTKQDAPADARDQYLTEKRTSTMTFEVRNERKRPKSDSH